MKDTNESDDSGHEFDHEVARDNIVMLKMVAAACPGLSEGGIPDGAVFRDDFFFGLKTIINRVSEDFEFLLDEYECSKRLASVTK